MKHVGFSLADYGIERLNQTKQLKREIEDWTHVLLLLDSRIVASTENYE